MAEGHFCSGMGGNKVKKLAPACLSMTIKIISILQEVSKPPTEVDRLPEACGLSETGTLPSESNSRTRRKWNEIITAANVDWGSRIMFPLFFSVFTAIYLAYYLPGPS